MVTTFLDAQAAPKNELKVLYRRRWNLELDLRNLNTTLDIERLRCKTPEMVIKELWVYLLAYNLIPLLMAQAALLADQIPRQGEIGDASLGSPTWVSIARTVGASVMEAIISISPSQRSASP